MLLLFGLLLSTVLAGAWAWRLSRELRAGVASFAGGEQVSRAISPIAYWIVIGGQCAALLAWLVGATALLLLLLKGSPSTFN